MLRHRSTVLALSLAFSAAAGAHADVFSSASPWIAQVQNDFITSSFDSVPVSNPYTFGPSNGFTIQISAADTGSPNVGQYQSFSPVILGIRATNNLGTIVINVSGNRPANAFFMDAGVVGTLSSVLMAAPVRVTTDRGDSYTFNTPAGGTGFGVVTVQPFRQLRVQIASTAGLGGLGNVFLNSLTIAQGNRPSNADDCGSAVSITKGEWIIDSRAATTTQIITCADTGADVWYRYVAGVSGIADVTTTGSEFDTTLSVHGPNCADTGTTIACNDDIDYPANAGSQLQFSTQAGHAYLIRVGGFQGLAGRGRLLITETANCPGDFNNSGVVSVQDIFDFLAAYFAGCP